MHISEEQISALKPYIKRFREMTFEELSIWANKRKELHEQIKHNNGNVYQIEIQVHWEDRNKQEIRVVGYADPNKSRRWWQKYISKGVDGFIKRQDGTFVGE